MRYSLITEKERERVRKNMKSDTTNRKTYQAEIGKEEKLRKSSFSITCVEDCDIAVMMRRKKKMVGGG